MSEGTKKSRHVALEQLKLMVEFMSQHPDFASGTLRTLEARHQSKQLWSELAKILNNRRGVKKTYIGWSKYWSDFKNKLKKKVIERKKRKHGSVAKDTKPFTKLEKQALSILGPIFGKRQSKPYNGFAPCDPLPIEIKQESMIESALLTNGHYKVIGLESDQSAQSSDDDECIEDGDQSSEETLLNNIYPKWLMEIEQKRADADLRRAKAEEHRAETAAKTAEALMVQSEAMKKLAEAADRQADAMLRIAMVMECRRPDDLSVIQSRHLSGYR